MDDNPNAYRPGSREDFDRLYSDHYPRLVRTLYGVLGDPAAAEDCVQEAFVQAFKAWPRPSQELVTGGGWRPEA